MTFKVFGSFEKCTDELLEDFNVSYSIFGLICDEFCKCFGSVYILVKIYGSF